MYHRVAALQRDPYGLAVHPDHFAAHVERLQKTGIVVPLEDVIQRGLRGRIAITFDDGYADNATLAAPILADAGLPATWFITSGRLGARGFWWDRLGEAFLGAAPSLTSIDLTVAGRELWLDLRTPVARLTALKFINRQIRRLPPESVETAVDEVVLALGQPDMVDSGVTMTVAQLRELAALPMQEIGAHTRTHQHLNQQPSDVQRAEIAGSVSDLAELLHRQIRSFAYPFGVPDAVGSLAPRLVEEAGCLLACTTSPGSVRRRTNRYLLPRLYVQDWHGDEFASQLRTALQAG